MNNKYMQVINNAIIAIGAHPDDIELGCGATLRKLVQQGISVFTITLCNGSKGNQTSKNRFHESMRAFELLKTTENFFLEFEDTKLASKLNEIIKALERILSELSDNYNITRIYTMYQHDRHQDHQTTFYASTIAFRGVPQIICYETPSSGVEFNPKIFEEIDDFLIDIKIKAIQLHESQKHRIYVSESYLKSIAIFRGQQAGYPLCEAFVPYKMVF